MAAERSRLRSSCATAARPHVWAAGGARRAPGKRRLLPPGPEASPAGEPHLFRTQLRRGEGTARVGRDHLQRPAAVSVGAGSRGSRRSRVPSRARALSSGRLTLRGGRRRSPQSLGGAARPALLSRRGLRLHPGPSAAAGRAGSTAHPGPAEGGRWARPLLGGSSCEGSRLPSEGESAAEALPLLRLPASAQRQAPRPGLLPRGSARGSAQSLRAASARLAGEGQLRVAPPPSRARRAAAAIAKPRSPPSSRPPAPTAARPRHKGESLQLPERPARRAPPRPRPPHRPRPRRPPLVGRATPRPLPAAPLTIEVASGQVERGRPARGRPPCWGRRWGRVWFGGAWSGLAGPQGRRGRREQRESRGQGAAVLLELPGQGHSGESSPEPVSWVAGAPGSQSRV